MIQLKLSQTSNLRQAIKYSISPLFELAASLHVLANSNRPARFQEWAASTLLTFTSERMIAEWHYFLPVFERMTPRFFDPFRTQKVMAIDDQYHYFTNLPTFDFVASMLSCLHRPDDQPAFAIETDIEVDADFVKGRFILFISTYWQLLFESKWEEIAPKFVREAEQIELVLQDANQAIAFLQSIAAFVTYELNDGMFAVAAASEQTAAVESLILYPSLFCLSEPVLSVSNDTLHLVYNCAERSGTPV